MKETIRSKDEHPAQVFVSGTWRPEKAEPFREQAVHLGSSIARRGFDLACGPGTGIARHVIDGFRVIANGGTVRYYLPSRTEMDAVGEAVEPGADEVIETGFDYPMRNVFQIKQCQGLFVLTGGDGALEEILPAVIDYHVPVALVRGTGSAADAIKSLLEIYPEWRRWTLFGDDVGGIIDAFLDRVELSRVTSNQSTE